MKTKKVVLITGASAGIGKSAAEKLLQNNFTVYTAARRVEQMKDLEKKGAKTIYLDVTDDASMIACVDKIIRLEGRIDVLVNNAGYGAYGAVEDVSLEVARRQLEVNVFGLARMTQLVLPHMRKEHSGRILNVSSIGGKIATPLGAWYHATKYAVEGFSDCLRLETKPFGIDVVVIQPGIIKSEWDQIAMKSMLEASGKTAYADIAHHTAKSSGHFYSSPNASTPSVIGEIILKACLAKRPKTRYAKGYMAKPILLTRKLLPDRLFDRIITSM